MNDARTYPKRIYAGHLGAGRRTWKQDLFDATEKAHTCEYVRADIAAQMLEALRYVETCCVSEAAYPHASAEDRKMRDMVIAAIPKATGEQP